VALLGSGANQTTLRLVEAWRRLGIDAALVTGPELASLEPSAVVIGRLDVLPTVDGVEPGLFELLMRERRGGDVRNTTAALLAAHDKLRTARLLGAAGIPQPRYAWARAPDDAIDVAAPLVVKPRFGSWGKAVHRCRTEPEARALLRRLAERPWFRRHGAIVQELVPPVGHDLRVLVAGGTVIGAVERTSAPGEWRTNVALGGTKAPAEIGTDVADLALAAARALGCDLVAVDLLPIAREAYVVLELNAAADFDDAYVAPGRDVAAEVARALGLTAPARRAREGRPPRAEAA
jgi:RimK family alpha-L-glutamate ligase